MHCFDKKMYLVENYRSFEKLFLHLKMHYFDKNVPFRKQSASGKIVFTFKNA